jgi:hypothetical protein
MYNRETKKIIWTTKDVPPEDKKAIPIREYQKLKGGYAFEKQGNPPADPDLQPLINRDNKIRTLRRVSNTLMTHGAFHDWNQTQREERLLQYGNVTKLEQEAFDAIDNLIGTQVKEQQEAVIEYLDQQKMEDEIHQRWMNKKEVKECGQKISSKHSSNTKQKKKQPDKRERNID